MKICIWTSSVFKLGGTKRVITLIANEMIKSGHEVTIVTFDSQEIENRSMYGLDERIKVEYMDSKQYREKKYSPMRYVRSFIKATNNKTGCFNRPSCVEILKNSFYPKYIQKKYIEYFNKYDFELIVATAGLSLVLAMIADSLNAKTAGWQHSSYMAYLNTKNVLFWKKDEILKKYFKHLDAVLVLNQYDKIEFDKNIGLNSWIMENPQSFVSDVKTNVENKNFFAALRFVNAKGVDLLLKSFAEFCSVNDEWNLIIAGDGPDRKKVLNLVWKYGLQERVRFTGITNNVQKYYLESSVYLLSSRWEGWGLVVIEAFEMGMPVIAYDIGPMDLLITNGVDGFIIEPYDTVKYAAAMVKLASDYELRKGMAIKAIDKAKLFTTERIFEQWDKLLKEI